MMLVQRRLQGCISHLLYSPGECTWIMSVRDLKVVFKFLLSPAVGIVQVLDYLPMFEQDYPRADVYGMLQVVATYQDSGLG